MLGQLHLQLEPLVGGGQLSGLNLQLFSLCQKLFLLLLKLVRLGEQFVSLGLYLCFLLLRELHLLLELFI
ncbi:hypothetical protein D3C76_1646780 [compost metagenome]